MLLFYSVAMNPLIRNIPLGLILLSTATLISIKVMAKQRMERCVPHMKPIPALQELTKTLPWLKQDCIDSTPAK
jgi:hypothetical protein